LASFFGFAGLGKVLARGLVPVLRRLVLVLREELAGEKQQGQKPKLVKAALTLRPER
jgi:hypothetical protein